MTRRDLLDWLAHRQPARPAALAERMDRAIADLPEELLAGAASRAAALGNIGLVMLSDLTKLGPQAEGLALDLLAADAFVTYAFEAAAEDGEPLTPLAETFAREAAR